MDYCDDPYQDGWILKQLREEHDALMAHAAAVVRAYNPTVGVFTEVEDDALNLALDELGGWISDHHPDWQG